MARLPGMAIQHERRTTLDSDGSASPGDLVAAGANGQVTQADGTDDPDVIGVLSNSKDNVEGHEAGDKVSVHIGGIVVMKVTAGVAVFDGIGPSSTEGAGTSGGTDGRAYSDAGGEFLGPIPDGYAAVDLDGVL